jgi:hypothetical protein
MVLLAAAAPAQWKRYAETYQGGGTDSPPTHSLQYFRVHPCSRSDKKDRFTYCEEPPSEAEIQRRVQTRTNLRVVGEIGEFTIYDLEYFLGVSEPGPDMKSVLVETPGHQFHEILVQEGSYPGILFPTEIVKAGQQPVIKARYEDGGMDRTSIERYFVILEGVAMLLDFGPVGRAAEQAVPSGSRTYNPSQVFDFTSLTYSVGTELEGRNVIPRMACCDGRVDVPFRIEKGTVVAGKAEYTPE